MLIMYHKLVYRDVMVMIIFIIMVMKVIGLVGICVMLVGLRKIIAGNVPIIVH